MKAIQIHTFLIHKLIDSISKKTTPSDHEFKKCTWITYSVDIRCIFLLKKLGYKKLKLKDLSQSLETSWDQWMASKLYIGSEVVSRGGQGRPKLPMAKPERY